MTMISNQQGQSESGSFQLWYLLNFCFGFIWPGMFLVLTQTFVLEITGSAAVAGLVLGVIALGGLTTPIFGRLADRYRTHRPVQILAYSLVMVGIATMGLTEDELTLILAAVLVGVGLGPAFSISNVYAVSTGLSPEDEARAVAWLQRMLFSGTIVGGFVIAYLLRLQEQGWVSYTTLFMICVVVMGVALLLAVFTTRDVAGRVDQAAPEQPARADKGTTPSKIAVDRVSRVTFGLALMVVFLNHLGWIGVSGQYVNFLAGAYGVDRSIAATVNSIAMLLSLLVIGYTGRWMGKAGPVPVLSAGMLSRVGLALALAVIGWMLGGSRGAIALALLVWAALRLVNPFTALGNPVLIARTAVGGSAQAQSLMVAMLALGIAVGNILSGLLAENFGWLALPWQTVVFCSLAFLLTRFRIRPHLHDGSNEPDQVSLLVESELDI